RVDFGLNALFVVRGLLQFDRCLHSGGAFGVVETTRQAAVRLGQSRGAAVIRSPAGGPTPPRSRADVSAQLQKDVDADSRRRSCAEISFSLSHVAIRKRE